MRRNIASFDSNARYMVGFYFRFVFDYGISLFNIIYVSDAWHSIITCCWLQNKKIQFISIYFEFIFCFEGVLLRGLMLPHVVVSLIMVNLYIFKTSKYRKYRRELMNQRISFVQTTAGLEMVYDY